MDDLESASGKHSRTMLDLRLAADGDREAFDRLFLQVEAKLSLYVRMRYRTPGQVGAREGADDILQRTYMEAMKAFSTFQYRGKGSFFRWMREIARIVIARTFETHKGVEKRATDREVPLDAMPPTQAQGVEAAGREPPPSPSREVYVGEKIAALARALEELPEHYREVVTLHKIEELTFAETASRTGRTEPGVKMIYFRAMTQLRDLLSRDRSMKDATEMLEGDSEDGL